MDDAEAHRALSEGAYKRVTHANDRAAEHGFEIVQEHTDTEKTRGHTLYKHKDTGGLVLSFRGTSVKRSKLRDLVTDAKLALGFIPKELREAKKTAEVIREQYPDAPLTLSGHSLGGSKAIFAGKALE